MLYSISILPRGNMPVRFADQLSAAVYDRLFNEVLSKGIYFDMPARAHQIFEVTVPAKTGAERIAGDGIKRTSQKYEQVNSFTG